MSCFDPQDIILTPSACLRVILDHVDYTRDACSITETIGAVLPEAVIVQARRTLENFDPFLDCPTVRKP
jgi:hypothetical protein